MTTYEIRVVDPTDDAALRAWWEVGAAASAERPGDPWPDWEANRLVLATQSPERDLVLVCAWDRGAAVGASMLQLPRNDNLHLVFAEVLVRPTHRRRGIGSLLVADVEERARALGRSTVLGETATMPGLEGAGLGLGLGHGYAVANREEVKVAELREAQARWPDVRAEVDAHLGDYRIVTWDTVAPEEHLAGFGGLLSGFLAQIPLGEMALEDSAWPPERVRASERRMREIGRHMFTAVALAPDGDVVGCSDVRVDAAAPQTAAVGLTLVAEAHRGRRLGLAMKLATHQMLLDAFPSCRRVSTSNARVNLHMTAVNERLGYRVVEDLIELQKVLVD